MVSSNRAHSARMDFAYSRIDRGHASSDCRIDLQNPKFRTGLAGSALHIGFADSRSCIPVVILAALVIATLQTLYDGSISMNSMNGNEKKKIE